jgi:hypothetical protein
MKRWSVFVFVAPLIGLLVLVAGVALIRIDALQEPGRFETVLASQAKHTLIG